MAHFPWKPNEIHKTLLVRITGLPQLLHDDNLPGNGSFDATPVAALAGGVLDTQRPAAQA
jgi:hypothetical protein